MNKLELELIRLDGFLIQLDKVISGMLEKEGFSSMDLSTVMGVRNDILNRINEIYSIQRNRDFWKDYNRPTPNHSHLC
jgi:hypothetical protein